MAAQSPVARKLGLDGPADEPCAIRLSEGREIGEIRLEVFLQEQVRGPEPRAREGEGVQPPLLVVSAG
jgi:hypothetical protein